MSVTVTEVSSGDSYTDDVDVFVANLPPWVALSGPPQAFEGDTLWFNGGAFDPGLADSLTLSYQWQMLNPVGLTIATSSDSTFSVLVPDDGTYTLALTVTDDDGATATDSIAIDVMNAAPVPRVAVTIGTGGGVDPLVFDNINPPPPVVTDEGQLVTLDASLSTDPARPTC